MDELQVTRSTFGFPFLSKLQTCLPKAWQAGKKPRAGALVLYFIPKFQTPFGFS